MIDDQTRILVLCTGNSCRSQMAEGILRHFLAKQKLLNAAAAVRSAGIEIHGLNPIAVRVMGEIDIDISHQTSNHVDDYAELEFDYVITVCDNAANACPTFPARTELLHFPFDDPAKTTGNKEEILTEFRRVRDQIRAKIVELLSAR